MDFLGWTTVMLLSVWHFGLVTAMAVPNSQGKYGRITPKIMIITMYWAESDAWYHETAKAELGDLLAVNITTPGLSMLYPHVHCLVDHSVCQVTAGEAEINAAATITALVLSDKFDLKQTYFLAGGIAGVNPKYGTLGSVALSQYAVQVALQHELDAREMPANFSTGYFSYGTDGPSVYPTILYGTEVFELSTALRDQAYSYALRANLSDRVSCVEYRERYKAFGVTYSAATNPPNVVKCDTATSDVYYSGALLSQAFENVTKVWTNGTGKYCMTASEDNAVLEVLVRAAVEGLVDFSRVLVVRSGANFDRPPPNVTAFEHLAFVDQVGVDVAVENFFRVGVAVIKGILEDWDSKFDQGLEPGNYIGDIFGSLGGSPDFGPGNIQGDGGKFVKPSGESGDLGHSLRPELAPRRALVRRGRL